MDSAVKKKGCRAPHRRNQSIATCAETFECCYVSFVILGVFDAKLGFAKIKILLIFTMLTTAIFPANRQWVLEVAFKFGQENAHDKHTLNCIKKG
jgi:hypothetical protein